jgi:Secretion system C-terminal sorting domain
MKKSVIFLLFSIAIFSVSVAQTVTTLKLTPMAQTTIANKDSFDVVLKSVLKNTSAKPKTIVWTRIFQTITSTWTVSICDKNTCWATRVNTETFTLAAGEESNIDVHLYPNATVGSAIVNVVLTDRDSSAVSLIGRYGFNLPVATQDSRNAYPDIKIYPNRTPQYFTIKDVENRVFEAAIFDNTGKQVSVFKNPTNQLLSVSDLAAGHYFVGLFNQKNEVMKVVALVKY